MARGRTVPLLTQPVIVTLFCAELDAHIAAIETGNSGPEPLADARVMLLRQIRTEIREGAPIEDAAAEVAAIRDETNRAFNDGGS